MNTQSPELPAILGGSPAVTLAHDDILRWPYLTETDAEAVLQVMCDGNLSRHRVVRQLEAAYAETIGRRHALAHCNGAAAFLAAYKALGLQPGDEVLVPATAPATTVMPMLWLGALPVFCDIEEHRLGIDPEEVDRRVTARTRAMVICHTYGMPVRLKGLLSLSKKHNLKVVEDASQALGACWRERPCGTFGDISIFRLQGDHLAQAGEGAVLLCDVEAYIHSALDLGDAPRLAERPSIGGSMAGMGLNSRMSPLCAAIGLTQFEQVVENNAMRNENLNYLSCRLEELGLNTFEAPRHIERVYSRFVLEYDADQYGLDTDQFIAALNLEGCEARPAGLASLCKHPLFAENGYNQIARLPTEAQRPDYRNITMPVTESIARSLIQLPVFPGPDDGILDQYLDAFEKVLGCAEEIADACGGGWRKVTGTYANLRVVG